MRKWGERERNCGKIEIRRKREKNKEISVGTNYEAEGRQEENC